MGKYDELVKRLRALAIDICLGRDVRKNDRDLYVTEAADAITALMRTNDALITEKCKLVEASRALQAENERLRAIAEAAKPIVYGMSEEWSFEHDNLFDALEALKGADHEKGE